MLMLLSTYIVSCTKMCAWNEYLYIKNRLQFSAFCKICKISTDNLKIMRKRNGYVPRLEITDFSVEKGTLKMSFPMNQYVILCNHNIVICKNGKTTDYKDGKIKYMIFEEEEVRIVIASPNRADEHIFFKLLTDSTGKYSFIDIIFESSADYIGSKGNLYSLPNWY